MAQFPGPSLIPNPNVYADAPLRLTSVFPVRDATPQQILSGIQYETDGCGLDFTEVDFDDYADCIRTAAKTFEEGLFFTETIAGDLAQLVALKCRPGALGGGTLEEFQDRAARRLRRTESAFLESKLQDYVTTNGDAVTVSGGGAADVIAALLEKSGEVNNPVLHLPLGLAFRMGDKLDWLAALGVIVVASPVYADDRAFLTGGLTIWGGAVSQTTVPAPETNYILALAERQYMMTIECADATADPSGMYYATVPLGGTGGSGDEGGFGL